MQRPVFEHGKLFYILCRNIEEESPNGDKFTYWQDLNTNINNFQPGDIVFACEVWGYDPADYDDSYRRDQQIDKIIKEEE